MFSHAFLAGKSLKRFSTDCLQVKNVKQLIPVSLFFSTQFVVLLFHESTSSECGIQERDCFNNSRKLFQNVEDHNKGDTACKERGEFTSSYGL